MVTMSILTFSPANTTPAGAAELSADLHEVSELWTRTGVSQFARDEIPAELIEHYRNGAAWAKTTIDCDLPWTVLAGVGWEETKHGKFNWTSYAGAQGPMQFLPGTWKAFGIDGNGDGVRDVWDWADATAASANYLCELDAADGKDDPRETYDALQGYNRGPAKTMKSFWGYSDSGLNRAWLYGEPANDSIGTVRFPGRPGAAGEWDLAVGESFDAAFQHRLGLARSGDVPVVGDWNGDGIDTVGVYRRESRRWVVTNDNKQVAYRNSDGLTPRFGTGTATPVVGDWNGDGIDNFGYVSVIKNGPRAGVLRWRLTLGVSRPTTDLTVQFGKRGDVPVVGDWDGDGIDTIGAFRPSTGEWLLSDDDRTITQFDAFGATPKFGRRGDRPIVGDWNGDGVDTVGVVRVEDGEAQWKLTNDLSNPTTEETIIFGDPGDMPLVGRWIKNG